MGDQVGGKKHVIKYLPWEEPQLIESCWRDEAGHTNETGGQSQNERK